MAIKKATIIRAILILIVVVNTLLEKLGLDIIPTDENFIAMCVETGIEIAAIIVGFWKNNSFTPEAIRADEFLKQLREEE